MKDTVSRQQELLDDVPMYPKHEMIKRITPTPITK